MSSAEDGPPGPLLRTERLLLRRWRAEDSAPFAQLNADPQVMEHFPATLTRAQSDALIEQIELCFKTHGYGAWAVEVDRLGIEEVVSFTSAGNARSRAVMERLGMRHDPAEDFLHPQIDVAHRLARHVLYRLRAGE